MDSRGNTRQRGRRSEQLAVDYLRQHHYRLIRTNYAIRQGEIDVIAMDLDTLCFVEVRSRKSTRFGHPFATISRKKQFRIIRAAQHFLAYGTAPRHNHIRFDAVAIYYLPTFHIELLKGAFDATC